METIYVLVLFALFSLASLLMERLKRRLSGWNEREPTMPPPPMSTEIVRPLPPRSEERTREPWSLAPRPPAPEPGLRAPLRATLRNRTHLRQAIIWTTILGPCRANDLYE